MNPELWKLKRDDRAQEHLARHEHSTTNDLPMRSGDAMDAIEPQQGEGGWIKPAMAPRDGYRS